MDQPVIALLLLAVFGATVYTGPALDDWRQRRRARRDAPMAKVVYLPSTALRQRDDICDPT